MALASFSDRYAGGNAGTTVTASGSFIPTVLGASASGMGYLYRVQFQFTMPSASAGPTANDQYYLGPLLIGYTLNGFWIDFPQADSSTGLTFELGDSATAGRYVASGGKFGQAQDFVSSFSGGAFSAGAAGDASLATVAASLPHFYGSYSTQRSETGSNRSIGVADDLILTCTHAVSGTYTAGVIRGFYDMTCAEYPLGTVTSNY